MLHSNVVLFGHMYCLPCLVDPSRSGGDSMIFGRTDFYETWCRYSRMDARCLEAILVSVALGKVVEF